MTGPIGSVSVLATGCPPTGTRTPFHISSVVVIAIIIVSLDFSLPTDLIGHGFFGPCLAGSYEHDLTLLFVG